MNAVVTLVEGSLGIVDGKLPEPYRNLPRFLPAEVGDGCGFFSFFLGSR